MKKKQEKKIIFLLTVLMFLVEDKAISSVPESLIDIYKRGTIQIVPDRAFSEGFDWQSLFIENNDSIAVGQNGDVFLTNRRNHCIYRFSPDGSLLNSFGRHGQGPGDLIAPSIKSILDNQYLTVDEYAESRSISLFDFSGKIKAKLRTQANCFSAVGLMNGVVAYYSTAIEGKETVGNIQNNVKLHFIDTIAGKETNIAFGRLNSAYIRFLGSGVLTPSPSYLGDVILNRMSDGNLLAGRSDSPELHVFSPEGRLIKTFELNIDPIPVSKQFIEKKKELTINNLQNQLRDKELLKQARRVIAESDFSVCFAEYLPYYKTIVVDSEGNILVFKWLNDEDNSKETFQVYSSAGKYLCEAVLDKGDYEIEMSAYCQTLQFTSSALYAIVSEADDEAPVQLMKILY